MHTLKLKEKKNPTTYYTADYCNASIIPIYKKKNLFINPILKASKGDETSVIQNLLQVVTPV